MTKLSRLHHVGIPVSNLQVSLPWYTKVLGLVDTEIRATGSGEVIEKALQVEGCDVTVAFLRVGEHVLLELLEYASPPSKPFQLRNCDVGALHVCFQVDDIMTTYSALRDEGISFNAEPVLLDQSAGNLAGYSFAYFRDPDGISLELFEVPPGKDY